MLAAASCAPRLPEAIRSCSVTVIAGTGRGTGTVFHARGRAFVLTAGHVLLDVVGEKDGKQAFGKVSITQQTWRNGRLAGHVASRVTVLAYSRYEAQDIALLEIERGWLFPDGARFDARRLRQGEAVHHVGSFYAPRLGHVYTRGTVGGVRRKWQGHVYDFAVIAVRRGSSGAGIFDGRGRYVGMFTRGHGCNLALCIPAWRISTWLSAVGFLWVVD